MKEDWRYGERKLQGKQPCVHFLWLNHSGFSNGGLEFWSWNGIWGSHKWTQLDDWYSYKIQIYITVWLHMTAVTYKYSWNDFSPRKLLLEWQLFTCKVFGLLFNLMYQELSLTTICLTGTKYYVHNIALHLWV
jgi:hypothetical protein